MGKVFAQVLHVLAAERVAAVRAMEDAFGAVQLHADPRSRQRFGRCAQMAQQRFDFPPLDVAADRVVEDRADEVVVFVAHGGPRVR